MIDFEKTFERLFIRLSNWNSLMKIFINIFLFFVITLTSACAQSKQQASTKLPMTHSLLHSKQGEKSTHLKVPFKNNQKVVVIDAGHGGEDFGTHSLSNPKYQEKSLNLTTAKLVKEYLQKMGYQIHMTRSKDVFISLEERAIFTNHLKPALFVSVHYNSAPSKEAEGIEVFFYRSTEDSLRTTQSKALAEAILKKVIVNTKAKSRGAKHGNYSVIRETKVPAVIVEGGFLTNASEMQKIKDPAYIKQLAWGIAQGVQDYLEKQCK